MLGQPKRALLVVAAVLSWCSSALADTLPRPAELGPDIRFWTRVYTEVDTQGGFIHDARHLEVVYEVLQFPDRTDRRARHRLVDAAKQRYKSILLRLAGGKRENLTLEEARVLALWPDGVGKAALRAAASRLRFQLGQADKFREGLARSGIWEGHIREILRQMGLPEELVALPHVESSFNPEARSRAGAAGLWQFTPSTGRRYLRIDARVDERMDPYLSTAAAAKLLSHNYAATGTWPLAITSYNHGTAGVRRAARELGTHDIARIVREYDRGRFGFASRNFYVAFLAALEIHANPAKYFGNIPRRSPQPTQVVRVPHDVGVAALQHALGIDDEVLRDHNPALRASVWRGARSVPRGFELRVPASAPREDLLAALSRVNEDGRAPPRKVDRPQPTVVGQVLQVEPGASGKTDRSGKASSAAKDADAAASRSARDAAIARAEEPEPASPDEAEEIAPALLAGAQPDLAADPSDYSVSADHSIEVQAAETLGHYADWLNLSAQRLRRVNGMRYRQPVVVGRRLALDFSRVGVAKFEDRRIAYHRNLQETFFKHYRIAGSSTHVVRKGESVSILAQRRFAVPVWLLRQYNPDMDFDAVAIGATITVPRVEKLDERESASGPGPT